MRKRKIVSIRVSSKKVSRFYATFCLACVQPIWSLGLTAGIAPLIPPFFWQLSKTPMIYTLGFTGLSVGSALILLACLSCKFPDNLFTRGLAYVGSHSYSIYLWHLAVLSGVPYLLARAGIVHPPIVQLASIIGCLVFGIAISKLVEFPVLRWRDRWLPPRN